MFSRRGILDIASWAAVLAILLACAWIRFRLLATPLERDEGDYAYLAQLLLQGIPPYTEAYDMRMPGIFAAYALVLAAFGQTGVAVHLGLLLVNSATIVLMFLLGRKLLDATTGIAAAASFGALSLTPTIQGIAANAEHFLILLVLAGILLLLRALDSRRSALLFFSGATLGLAFLIKQHGIFFVAFGGAVLVWSEFLQRPFAGRRCLSRSLVFATGAFAPVGLTFLAILLLADFEKFWLWTVTVPRDYVTAVPLHLGLDRLWERFNLVAAPALPLWCVAGIGLVAPAWSARARGRGALVLGFALFSFLSMTPGLLFRPHYFLQILPAAALLVGIAVSSIADLLARTRSTMLIRATQALVVLIPIYYLAYGEQAFLFRMSPTEASRYTYSLNPFPESLEIAHYIKRNSTPDDRIVVLGSEPQIYFYAQRRSATPYILMYPLMEYHPLVLEMQQEMIEGIERQEPKYLVFVNTASSWQQRAYSHTNVIRWAKDYAKRHYRRVGLVDIISAAETRYLWDDASVGQSPRSTNWISVFERSDE